MNRWAILLTFCTAAFILLLLPIGPHPDDVVAMQFVADHGYADVWTSPFLGKFYRPLTVSIVKLSVGVFGSTTWPLRVLQGLLIAASVHSVAALDQASPTARAAGGFVLLSSPLTFITVSPFAVGFADTIVLLALLGCVRVTYYDSNPQPKTSIWLWGLCVLALASKESGLLVLAFCFIEWVRRRKIGLGAAALALAGCYVALRMRMVSSRPFAFKSGFLLEMHSPAELQSMFGDAPYGFYAYNVASNLSAVLWYAPERGQFRVTALIVLLALACGATAWWVARHLRRTGGWRRHHALLALIPLNALLGYMYVRPRVMLVAHAAIAILFIPAFDGLWRDRRKLAIATLVLWLAVFVTALARLRIQAAA